MRLLALMLAAVLIAGSALAEDASSALVKDPFALLEGIDLSLCSGAGAWSTDIQIHADGTFKGTYHDSEMGDTADNYPNGSMYISEFSGKMSVVEQVSATIWKIRVDEVNQEGKTGEEKMCLPRQTQMDADRGRLDRRAPQQRDQLPGRREIRGHPEGRLPAHDRRLGLGERRRGGKLRSDASSVRSPDRPRRIDRVVRESHGIDACRPDETGSSRRRLPSYAEGRRSLWLT